MTYRVTDRYTSYPYGEHETRKEARKQVQALQRQQIRAEIIQTTNERLKPALNVRQTSVKACGACRFGIFDDGTYVCKRPGGPTFDAGEGQYWYTVCDLFRPYPNQSEGRASRG